MLKFNWKNAMWGIGAVAMSAGVAVASYMLDSKQEARAINTAVRGFDFADINAGTGCNQGKGSYSCKNKGNFTVDAAVSGTLPEGLWGYSNGGANDVSVDTWYDVDMSGQGKMTRDVSLDAGYSVASGDRIRWNHSSSQSTPTDLGCVNATDHQQMYGGNYTGMESCDANAIAAEGDNGVNMLLVRSFTAYWH